MNFYPYQIIACIIYLSFAAYPANECTDWQINHPEWIFCDDFESSDPLVSSGRYFEYGDNDGDFVLVDGVGVEESKGMKVVWQQGEVGAGGIKVAFGRNPNSYMNKQQISPNEDFREIYYRMYLKMEDGWEGNPAKLSRATVFTSSEDWRQAMIAHLWSDGNYHLLLDPASCVDANGNVECTKYNDFDNLQWLGYQSGTTPLFDSDHDDTWFCVEHHVKLNDPGQSNGIQEFWIDDSLEARRENMNFTGTYTEYAINAIFFENYWNDGSIKEQKRYFDNIVISTERIGCLDSNVAIKSYPSKTKETGRNGLHVRYIYKKEIVFIYANTLVTKKEYFPLIVYNAKGVIVDKVYVSKKQIINGFPLNISPISPGVYFIKISLSSYEISSTIAVP